MAPNSPTRSDRSWRETRRAHWPLRRRASLGTRRTNTPLPHSPRSPLGAPVGACPRDDSTSQDLPRSSALGPICPTPPCHPNPCICRPIHRRVARAGAPTACRRLPPHLRVTSILPPVMPLLRSLLLRAHRMYCGSVPCNPVCTPVPCCCALITHLSDDGILQLCISSPHAALASCGCGREAYRA